MLILRIFGFIWALPVTILSWIFFFFPHSIKGTFQNVYLTKDLAIVWDVDNFSRFGRDSMNGWYGFVLGANVCVIDTPREKENIEKYFHHEINGHVSQYFIFGIMFFPLYIAHTAWLLAFCKDKHSYLDNFLERWARKVAGQKINIPREEWTDGPNDRFPWN